MPRKKQPPSSLDGRWHIISMSTSGEDYLTTWEQVAHDRYGHVVSHTWSKDYLNSEEQAYIEFKNSRQGEFHFGHVHGRMTCHEETRDGEPGIEWSWQGNDEMDEADGLGWAVLKDGRLHGLFIFHEGDFTDFVAERA